MSTLNKALPVAVIGAGPVGLAAAAHLRDRGFEAVVFEAGSNIGANLQDYRHVRLFSPWRYNIDHVAAGLLAELDWRQPDLEALPTAGDVVDQYLKPLAEHPALARSIRLSHSVTRISRDGLDKVRTSSRDAAPFVLQVRTADGETQFRASAIIDSSGTWNQPNPIGANGLAALGETDLAPRIRYGMPDVLGRDRTRYAGKRVLVVGSGHSAAGSLIALAELAESTPGTQLVWAIRGDNLTRIFGGGDADGLPARGQLGQRLRQLRDSGRLQVQTNFRIDELRLGNGRVAVYAVSQGEARARIDNIDEIIAATGARPNLEMTRELRLKLDYWLESTELLAPLIDPNEHSCGSVRPHGYRELAHPEPGYYAVGARSYGRAPTFLMTTGYEQVRSVVAALAGDLAAANDVRLELPETGVCNVTFGTPEPADVACCGTSAPPRVISIGTVKTEGCCGGTPADPSAACCVADEKAKSAGQSGCGCSAPATAAEPRTRACCG